MLCDQMGTLTQEQILKLVDEAFESMKQDVQGMGNWSGVSNKDGILVKKGEKKGKGSEVPCFLACGEIGLSPKDFLEQVVEDKAGN